MDNKSQATPEVKLQILSLQITTENSWKFKSSAMWYCVVGQVITDASWDHTAITFMTAWQWTGWDHDASKSQELHAQWQCHNPEDFSHLQHHCENLKSGKDSLL